MNFYAQNGKKKIWWLNLQVLGGLVLTFHMIDRLLLSAHVILAFRIGVWEEHR